MRKFVPGRGWNHVVPPVRHAADKKSIIEKSSDASSSLFFSFWVLVSCFLFPYSPLPVSISFTFFAARVPGSSVPAGWVHRSHRHVASGPLMAFAPGRVLLMHGSHGPHRDGFWPSLGSTDTLTLCGQNCAWPAYLEHDMMTAPSETHMAHY